MQCPVCQFDNPKRAKFCNECGYDLRKTIDFKSAKTKERGVQITEAHPDKAPKPIKITGSKPKSRGTYQ